MLHIKHKHFYFLGHVYLHLFDNSYQNFLIHKNTNCEDINVFEFYYSVCYK